MAALDSSALLEAMLEDSGGVAVVFGGVTTYGHFEIVDVVYETGVQGTETTVVVATGVLSGLSRNAAITVDGDGYTISQARRIDDGGLTRIHLRSA